MSLLTKSTPTPQVSCPPDLSNDVDDLTINLQQRDMIIQQQKLQLQNLQSEIPAIKTDVYAMQNNMQTNSQIVQTENRTFYVSLLALVLLGIFWFIIYLYNQLLSKSLMVLLKNTNIFKDWHDLFTSPIPDNSDTDLLIRTMNANWEPIFTDMNRHVSRSRFYLFTVIFILVVGMSMILYSLIYHGTDTQSAFKRTSLCSFLILAFTFLFVNNSSMVLPFENSVGYSLVSATSKKFLNETMNHIFSHKFFQEKQVFPNTDIYLDFMMNTFSVKQFANVFSELFYNNDKYDFKINTNSESGITKTDLENLFRFVLQKQTIGHSCWIYFASLTSIIISMRYLITTL
jgi:hypothetical protein